MQSEKRSVAKHYQLLFAFTILGSLIIACNPKRPSREIMPHEKPARISTDECVETQPDSDTCEQKKEWGQCDESWMVKNDWCNITCMRCTPTTDGETPPAETPTTPVDTSSGGDADTQ